MLDDDDLQRVYQWVDEIPLSRPKRNISRDFADGVLTAEIVQHYFPRLIELHNYPAANSYSQKIYNWKTLNTKVFKKMGFQMQQDEMDASFRTVFLQHRVGILPRVRACSLRWCSELTNRATIGVLTVLLISMRGGPPRYMLTASAIMNVLEHALSKGVPELITVCFGANDSSIEAPSPARLATPS